MAAAVAARRTPARGSRGLDPSSGDPEGAGAPDNHASPPLGPRGRGAQARRSPPGNPTGSLRDWPGRSGRHLHVNGRESCLRFENRFWAGRVGLHSGPRGIKGTDAHTLSPSFTRSQSQRCLNSSSAPHFVMKRKPKAKCQLLRSPRSLFRGYTVSN